MVGLEGLTTYLSASSRGADAIVLMDSAVVEAPIGKALQRELHRAGVRSRTTVLGGPGDRDSIDVLAQQIASFGDATVIGIGGGSLLDQAKLAALLADEPAAARYLDLPQRSGLIMLPSSMARRRCLIAVPTTIGTGAEVSTSACLLGGRGKRLIAGTALRPDLGVLTPQAGETLPDELIREGVLEAFFRTVSPYVGDSNTSTDADRLAEEVAAQLVALGERVCSVLDGQQRPDGQTLMQITRLGGLSHLEEMHAARASFSARGWYLANELSFVYGIRKMQAVAVLLPALWSAVMCGDQRLGSAERLRHMWSSARRAGNPRWPAGPVDGIRALIDSWGLQQRIPIDEERLRAASTRVIRSWGGGLPMLAGLTHHDVRRLFQEAIA